MTLPSPACEPPADAGAHVPDPVVLPGTPSAWAAGGADSDVASSDSASAGSDRASADRAADKTSTSFESL